MKRFAKLSALCIIITFVVALFCLPAQAIGNTETKTIVSTGSVGTGTGKQTTLVDFTTSDLCGFEALGNTEEPAFAYSGNWNTNVLKIRIDSAEAETGVRGTLANASALKGASTLSLGVLAQYAKTTSHTLTLRLEGVDKTGAPLILESTAPASATYWQTVTFDISAFVAEANLDVSCTVTLLTDSNAEDEEFSLWVHSIYTNSLESSSDILVPVAAAVGGLVVGFVFFFVIYCATCKKNRRRR